MNMGLWKVGVERGENSTAISKREMLEYDLQKSKSRNHNNNC